MGLRRGIAVLLLTGIVLAAVSATAPARSCPGVTVEGSWKRIETPLRAAAFTVDDAGRIFVAGGGTIAVSSDGGCSWGDALRIDALLPEALTGERVTSLATVGESIVAAVAGGPYVVISADGGATWTVSGEGLDVPGDPVGLYPAPSGDAVYLIVRRDVSDGGLVAVGVPAQGIGATATVVYRSDDGGSTWTRGDAIGADYTGPNGTGLEGSSAPGAVWSLAVDPANSRHVLAATDGGIFGSVDGALTWTPVLPDPESHVRAVALWRGAGGAPAAVAVDPQTGTVFSTDAVGGAWRERVHTQLRTEMMGQFPNAAAWAWAAAGPAGDVVLAGPKGLFRIAGEELAGATSPSLAGTGGAATDLRFVAGAVWARRLDGSAVVTEMPHHTAASPRPRGPRAVDDFGHLDGRIAGLPDPPVDGGAARLTPARRTVELAPGQAATVTVDAHLGPRPVAVDLFFVVDTTSSMDQTIRGLVGGMEDIVVGLARSGIRLRAGVGAFRTYPREGDRVNVDYAYRRMRALGPVDADLLRALYELEGSGSSGANLTALYQAVTGAGQDVLPPGPSKADVAPGGQAGFRDGALPVVMHFADTWFGTPERGDPNGYYAPGTWPGPSMGAAAAVLRDEGVLHLGVALQPGSGGTVFADADVVDDMRTVSQATGSLAGERGADCDGDGRVDLAPGEPLVCPLDRDADAGGVASVVTGLVAALERRGDVSLAEAGDSGFVRTVTPPVHGGVDLRAEQRLRFEVTVRCDLRDAGTRGPVSLDLLVGDEAVAQSAFEVSCAELPATVPAPPQTPALLAPLPPIPVPPPPHPVPGPGPGSVTAPAPVQAPAPAQAPGGQPHAATVAQRQQQPQMALVTAAQQVRAQTQMQHALVRTRGRDPLASARLWTAVGGLSIVWMWGLARATATRVRGAAARR